MKLSFIIIALVWSDGFCLYHKSDAQHCPLIWPQLLQDGTEINLPLKTVNNVDLTIQVFPFNTERKNVKELIFIVKACLLRFWFSK